MKINKKNIVITIMILILGLFSWKQISNSQTNSPKEIVDTTLDELDASDEQSLYISTTHGSEITNNKGIFTTFSLEPFKNEYRVEIYRYSISITAGDKNFRAAIKYENGKYFHKIFKKGKLEHSISNEEIDIIKKYYNKKKFVINHLDKFYKFATSIDKTKEFKNKEFDLSKVKWIEGLNWEKSLAN